MLLRRTTLFLMLLSTATTWISGQGYFQKLYSFGQPAGFSFDLQLLPDGKTAFLTSTIQVADSTERTNLTLLDEKGELIWSKLLKTGAFNRGAYIAVAADGNLVIGMNALNSIDPPFSAILKISVASGEILWESYFSLPSYNNPPFYPDWYSATISRIISLDDGGYAVLAARYGPVFTGAEGVTVVFKLNENGNLLWEKTWANKQHVVGRDLMKNSLGELYVAANRSDSIINGQALLIKLSPDGTTLWNKVIDDIFIHNAQVDAADNVWLVGHGHEQFKSTQVVKLNGDGNILWSKSYETDLPHGLEVFDSQIMTNDDLIICANDPLNGTHVSVLSRIDAAGKLRWAKKYVAAKQNTFLTRVATNTAGEIAAGGFAGETITELTAWMIKTDPTGNIPNCCLGSQSFIARDVVLGFMPFDLLTTFTSIETGGATVVENVVPDIMTICPAYTDPSSPNAFTPNSDQINDLFLPHFSCPPETIRFAVFNRWGNKVFETNDPASTGWDGRSGNQPAPADVYSWLLEYDTSIEGKLESKQEKGEVTLLR